MDMPANERIALAAKAGVNEQYLYQCLSGRRDMRVKLAVHVVRCSGDRVKRWDLRQNDWWEQWPELIGSPGAPAVPRPRRRRAVAVEA